MKERERKWLFDKVPDNYLEEYMIEQAYISTQPEVRIRRKRKLWGDCTYKLCIKGKGDIERDEVEKPLNEEEFKQLMAIGKIDENQFIHKYSYAYAFKGYKLVISIVDHNRPTKFIYGEIEFDTIDEANKFEAPEWFGKEVTYDPKYKMCNYWIRTRLGNDMKSIE